MTTTTATLISRSLEMIAENQAPSGAWVAAPDYESYDYCWIRDGAFIAAAMDAYGHEDQASRFHQWVSRTVLRYRHKVEDLLASDTANRGTDDPLNPLPDEYVLHTRFTTDGDESGEPWGNFQLDGYGFWLTSVIRHTRATGEDLDIYRPAIETVAAYLAETWQLPSFDCWEEYPTRRHMATLAAVGKGLSEAARILSDPHLELVAREIVSELRRHARQSGSLLKFIPTNNTATSETENQAENAVAGHERVGAPLPVDTIDASLLLTIGTFGPFGPSDEIGAATLRRIRRDLVVNGGVHRYLRDEYYGGGLWVVLSGALAEILATVEPDAADAICQWIESTADAAGNLPEQVPDALRNPAGLKAWTDRWGEPARPLLWSHAMYLLARAARGSAVKESNR